MVDLCKDCKASGLPILPVRYTVVPTTVLPALPAWASADRVKSVPLSSDFHYALRTVRAGFVYLFYAKNAWGANQWECYVVTDDGVLVKQPNPAVARPLAKLSCARHGPSNARLRHLVIERPEECGPTWIAFSPHPWSDETVKEYASNSKLRNARMQTIHPAQMAEGAKHSHGTVASVAALQNVLEYAPNLNEGMLPFNGAVGGFSKEDGSFRADLLNRICTLTPWHLRQSDADADLKWMQERAKKPGGGEHTPHVLALWDALGIAHELNGFRNDAAGWVDLYSKERSMEIAASVELDGLRDALVNKAGVEQKATQDRMLSNASSGYSPQEAAQRRANAMKLLEPQRSRQLELCDITEDWGRRQVPVTLGYGSRLQAANTLDEPQRSREIALIKADVNRFVASRAKNYGDNINRAGAEAWPKYEACLDRPALDLFQQNQGKLTAASKAIIDRRTATLIAWLEAPLFIDALEDFHPTSIGDGVLFEDAVTGATFGLGITPIGATKIDEWVKQADATVKSNLLWRVLALNQQDAMDSLNAALKEAQQHLADQTLSARLNWVGYTSKSLKGLADAYKKAQGVYDANVKAASATGSVVFGARISPVNMRGIDGHAITFGNFVFRAFALDKLGDYASEKIIQHIFSIRAFVDPLDSERLIAEQAKTEQLAREQTLRRLQATQAFMRMDTPELRSAQTEALKSAWTEFKTGTDKVKIGQAIKDTRLAVVVGLIEGVNFMKLIADCKRKGDKKSYLSLLASGMTITSALFDVAATVTKNLPAGNGAPGLPGLGGESWSYQTIKAWGGVMSAGASFVGGWLDWVEAGKADSKGYTTLFALYVAKSGVTLVSGALTLAVTFTYAAPLVSRVTGRAAAGAVIEQVGAKAAAVIGFRILGMAAGGWITVGTLVVQVVIWQVTPNALQDWVNHCAFGKKGRRKDTSGYQAAKEQEDKLTEALVEMGLQ